MSSPLQEIMKLYAKKYLWWQSETESIQDPKRITAQVMELGDYVDVLNLLNLLGEDYFCQVLSQAQPGMFSPKSWAYWHYRLNIAERPQDIPPMPRRTYV